MKRLFDVIFSIILIIIFSPVILIISGLIKITSKGPVVFKQQRIGKDKRQFKIYKFRTMYIDTPKDVPTHMLISPEKFITPIGKFLRKSSLDELLQLFNVLTGDMSFVGPRPALYNQYDLISLRDRYNINSIRPGITGWAQINGRDELSISEKVKLDRYYKERLSLLFDIKILFKTIISITTSRGIVEGSQKL